MTRLTDAGDVQTVAVSFCVVDQLNRLAEVRFVKPIKKLLELEH